MADFIVTNNNDSGKGSLRQAILDANNHDGADRILVSGNIKLNSAIEITDSVSIVNVGKTIITQKGSDRLFYIDDGDADKISRVNFIGIRMRGGNTEGSGGAIFSQEDLGLFRSNLVGNTAGDRGGAVYIEGAKLTTNRTNIINNKARTGGAVALGFGSLGKLANSNISGNTASDDGGGIAASYGSDLELFKSEISGNTASDAGGISAYYNSSVKLAQTTVSDNTASKLGGGIGAVYGSQVEVVRSTISGNQAKFDGGISLNSSALQMSASEVANNQADNVGGIGVSYYSQALISNSNISGNTATKGDAGGIGVSYISSLELDSSDVTNNQANQFAGGIKVDLGSQAAIAKSSISGNQAKASGGIHVVDNSSLSLVESQVSGNVARKFQGGGIGIADSGKAEITDSSIVNNRANQAEGGGIDVARTSSLKLDNTLVAENKAADIGGGINADTNSEVAIKDSTVADNKARIGGGLSAANGSSLSLTDVAVIDNLATEFGGGINAYFDSSLEIERGRVEGNAAPLVGGINLANGSAGKLSNTTIANNVAETSGGGINVYLDSQLEAFNTAITGNINGGIQSFGENNSVTLIASPVKDNTLADISGDGINEVTSQIIEAENITDLSGYRLESNALASGGQLLSLAGRDSGEVGTASFNFTGKSGNYTVKIGTYDENDGAATIELAQQGNAIGSIVLDDNSGGNSISADTQVTKVIATNIYINQGDSFSLTGFEDGNEHARIDFIEFAAVGANGEEAEPNTGGETPIVNPDPTPTADTIRWEAEAADSLIGYRTENIAGASGGTVLSLIGEAQGEAGSASFTVGSTGTYDILLASYDENDGAASFNVELNGSRIGETLSLNQDLGSNIANAQTAITETIAFGVSLEAGDILTVNGLENGGEHARLDYLEFIPTDAI